MDDHKNMHSGDERIAHQPWVRGILEMSPHGEIVRVIGECAKQIREKNSHCFIIMAFTTEIPPEFGTP